MSDPMRVAAARPRPVPEANEPRFERAVRRRAPGARLEAGVTAQGVASLARPSKQAAMGRRLDALLEQSRGPYSVGGKSVGVTPAFRSLYPGSAKYSPQTYLHKIRSEVGPSVWKQIAMSAAHATGSRGSLKDIQRVTQALIDSPLGKAELEGASKSPELAIRKLMKEHGIGLDCKGYALHGFLEARAENGVRPPNAKYGYPATDVQPHQSDKLKEVGIHAARTGDLIRLSPDGGRDHNVIVRSKQDLVIPPGASLIALGKSPSAAFLKNPQGGPTNITMLTVDASWGDARSEDGAVGGVERRVWLRNESSGKWACLDRFGNFKTSDGPDGHKSAVVYRPKAEQ